MAVSAGELDDDGALVRAVQAGDTEAFATLFTRYYPAVRKACARRLGNVVEADEMAQAAFVKALERINQCQGDRRFGPWVHVIARYLCVDAARARARVVPTEDPVSEDHSSGGLPEDGLLDRERTKHVHLALAALPERQRKVVIARTFEGRGPVEIAASLGLSVAAVDSLLLRARRGLALAYERVAGEGGAAATLTSASAASALGGTIAVGPQRVVDGMASAGQAISNAAGGVASTAASIPPVRGIGAGVVSAVMAASLALTGSVPTAPELPQRNPVVADPASSGESQSAVESMGALAQNPKGFVFEQSRVGDTGPTSFPTGGLLGDPKSGSRSDSAASPTRSSLPVLGDALDSLTGALGLTPANPAPAGATTATGRTNANKATPTPEAGGSPSTSTSTPLGAINGIDIPPLPALLPDLSPGSAPNLGNKVTDSVDTITGTVGGALDGLVPAAKPAPGTSEASGARQEQLTITTLVSPKPKSARKTKPDPGPAPATAVTSELTRTVGGLLK